MRADTNVHIVSKRNSLTLPFWLFAFCGCSKALHETVLCLVCWCYFVRAFPSPCASPPPFDEYVLRQKYGCENPILSLYFSFSLPFSLNWIFYLVCFFNRVHLESFFRFFLLLLICSYTKQWLCTILDSGWMESFCQFGWQTRGQRMHTQRKKNPHCLAQSTLCNTYVLFLFFYFNVAYCWLRADCIHTNIKRIGSNAEEFGSI